MISLYEKKLVIQEDTGKDTRHAFLRLWELHGLWHKKEKNHIIEDALYSESAVRKIWKKPWMGAGNCILNLNEFEGVDLSPLDFKPPYRSKKFEGKW